MLRLFTIVAACSLAAGCQDDEKVFKGDGGNESKPLASLLPEGAGVNGLGATNQAPTEAAHVTFDLNVESKTKTALCQGEVKLVIMSDFTMQFPASKVHCGSMTIDLGTALGGGAGGEKEEGNISSTNGVLNFKKIAGAEFDPPRPFLIGPVVQNPDKYKGFTQHTDHQATASSGSGSGSFDIKVEDVQTTLDNKFIKGDFKNVMYWTIAADGFDGIKKKSEGLIFRKIEWFWNTNPIMIPRVVIYGELGDLIEAEDTTNQIVGELKIALDAKEYNFNGGSK